METRDPKFSSATGGDEGATIDELIEALGVSSDQHCDHSADGLTEKSRVIDQDEYYEDLIPPEVLFPDEASQSG